MSTISGLGGANRSWDSAQQNRRAEHEAKMFAKVDSDGSGSVDATELASMLSHAGQSGDSAELLKKMDSDGNGSLSSDELSQGLRDLMPPPSSTMDFAQSRGAANDDGDGDRDAFASLDTDGDGQLSRAEFEAGRPQPPQGAGGPPPVQAGGGSSGTGATSASSSASVDPLDTNKDGTVSEIERLAGQLKELAKAGSDSTAQGSSSEIAALVQKLYDQISRNWLQPASTVQAGQVDVSA